MRTLPFEGAAGEPAAPPLAQTPCEASALLADLTGPCTLRDGVVVMVRAIRDEDMQRLQAFHLGLSSRTLYLRFGHLLAGFPEELAAWLTHVDGDRRMAFVATDTAHEEARARQTIIAEAIVAKELTQAARSNSQLTIAPEYVRYELLDGVKIAHNYLHDIYAHPSP